MRENSVAIYGDYIYKAYAKLNLTLDITGKRADGYHEIVTIMQTVTLFDEIIIESGGSNKPFSVSVEWGGDAENIPPLNKEDNLVYKGAMAFFDETGIDGRGLSVLLKKNIPTGAGMGGGSSDCAMIIRTLNYRFGEPLSKSRLMEIGARLGADVPFFLIGGTALCKGIGEKVTPLKAFGGVLPWYVIIKPTCSINTKTAYDRLDALPSMRHPQVQKAADAIQSMKAGDTAQIKEMFKLCGNVFEDIPMPIEIANAKQRLLELGAFHAMMTGSGSAVFGVFFDEAAAKCCCKELEGQGVSVYLAQNQYNAE